MARISLRNVEKRYDDVVALEHCSLEIADHEFVVRASGGFRFRTAPDLSTGCDLPSGSGVFSCTSSRLAKEHFAPLDPETVLGKIAGQNGRTVLRGGYSIAYTREGFNAYEAMFGSNDGPSITLDVSPSISPDIFTAGNVLYRNGNFPIRQPPADASRFPLTPGFRFAASLPIRFA